MDYLEPTFHHFHQQHHDQLSHAAPYSEHNSHIYLNTMVQHSSSMMPMPVAKTNETKPRLGKEEVEILEREFKKNPKPTTQTKKQYADDMDVELARINVRSINAFGLTQLTAFQRTGSRIVERSGSRRKNWKLMNYSKAKRQRAIQNLRLPTFTTVVLATHSSCLYNMPTHFQ